MNDVSLAPSSALTIGQIGAGLVLVGAASFFGATLVSALGRDRPRWNEYGKWLFIVGGAAVFGAGAALAWLFLHDQFEFQYIAEHSRKELAPEYKIAAIWSGQQGSFLLWAVTSTLFGLFTFAGTGKYRRWFIAAYSLFLGTLCGILCYETPFALFNQLVFAGQAYMPPNGQGLVPSLQNYWVVIHPPTIFLGFGSLTVLFAYAVSAMLTGDLKSWAAQVRPWALVSLSVLGMGVVMGGLWAYETQGWGGFWAWDPAENVSLVPWLLVAAFIHGLIVQTTRNRWSGTNALLGGLPFLLYFYGTFLVRSGFLDKFSVHSFAQMNRSALWILLGALLVFVISFFTIWIIRGLKLAKQTDAPAKPEGFAREAAYQTGVIIVAALAITVAIGMSVPFLAGLTGKNAKVVEEPLYHQVVAWFFVPIMLLMAAGPFLSWRRMGWKEFANRVTGVLGVAICATAIVYFAGHSSWDTGAVLQFPFGLNVPRVPWVMFLCFLAILAVTANCWRLAETFKQSKLGTGGFVAHLGLATILAGLVLSRGLEKKQDVLVMSGSPGTALGYQIAVDGMTSDPVTDTDNRVKFTVTSVGTEQRFVALPKFFYSMEGSDMQPFTGPHIQRSLSHDMYLSMAPPLTNLWDEPRHFSIGQTVEGNDISITYLGLSRHGEPGQAGTAFGARLRVVEDGKVYFGEPKFTLGQGPDSPQVTPSLRATLSGMDASDDSILLQMPYTSTLYPLELYYKPMTILIWIGTGVMTIGGLLSAWYRRRKRGEQQLSLKAAA